MTELNHAPTGVRQTISEGNAFDGTLPDSGNYSIVPEEDVVEYDHITGGNDGGLISFYKVFDPEQNAGRDVFKPWVPTIYLSFGSGVGWNLYVTNGRRNGTSETLDDTTRDIEIASGTGSEMVSFRRELLPRQNLRVTSDAVDADGGEILAVATATYTEYGRLS